MLRLSSLKRASISRPLRNRLVFASCRSVFIPRKGYVGVDHEPAPRGRESIQLVDKVDLNDPDIQEIAATRNISINKTKKSMEAELIRDAMRDTQADRSQSLIIETALHETGMDKEFELSSITANVRSSVAEKLGALETQMSQTDWNKVAASAEEQQRLKETVSRQVEELRLQLKNLDQVHPDAPREAPPAKKLNLHQFCI